MPVPLHVKMILMLVVVAWIVSIGLIERPWWGDRVRGPEGAYEQLLKQWIDRTPEPERKWKWYLGGNYDEAAMAQFIYNYLRYQRGLDPPSPPDLTPLTLEGYVDNSFRPHPRDELYQYLLVLDELFPADG